MRRFLRNLQLSQRINLGFSLIMLLVVLLGVISMVLMRQMKENSRIIHQHTLVTNQTLYGIQANVYHINSRMKDLLTAGKSELALQKIQKEVDSLHLSTEALLNLLEDRYFGPPSHLEETRRMLSAYQQLRHREFTLMEKNDPEAFVKILQTDVPKLLNKLNLQILMLTKHSTASGQALYKNIQKKNYRAIQITAVLIFFIAIIVYVVKIGLSDSIINPIKKLTEVLEKLSDGNLRQPISLDQQDEIGIMAYKLMEVQQNLQQKSEVANRIAKGNFDKQALIRSEEDELAIAINQIAESLKEVVNHANAIALGDLSWQVLAKSDLDQLGNALSLMQSSLRGVVFHAKKIAKGDFSARVVVVSEKDELGKALQHMTNSLLQSKNRAEIQSRIKTGQHQIGQAIRGELSLKEISRKIISTLCEYTGALAGTFYVAEEQGSTYVLSATYGINFGQAPAQISVGENLVGQSIAQKEIITRMQLPQGYFKVQSASGSATPGWLIIVPVEFENQIIAAFELAGFEAPPPEDIEFLELAVENIAIGVNTAKSREKLNQLLNNISKQADELRKQREELTMANTELEEKTYRLEKQKTEISQKNHQLQQTRATLEEKARQLETTSRYKSEFLANMSHELRSPLNSLLVLSENLHKNPTGNLSDKEKESVRIIYRSGQELLNLISDILDLSKIEAGKMEFNFEEVSLDDSLRKTIESFMPLAVQKNITLEADNFCPNDNMVYTDGQRFEQIIKNLVSNAVKFTKQGGVMLTIKPGKNSGYLTFEIKDTGIGIEQSKQKLIFEAFTQADGSTSRHYGGTGLGLSITKDLCRQLNIEISLTSQPGTGTTFMLQVPRKPKEKTLTQKLITTSNQKNNLFADEIQQYPPSHWKGRAIVVGNTMRPLFAMSQWLANSALQIGKFANPDHIESVLAYRLAILIVSEPLPTEPEFKKWLNKLATCPGLIVLLAPEANKKFKPILLKKSNITYLEYPITTQHIAKTVNKMFLAQSSL